MSATIPQPTPEQLRALSPADQETLKVYLDELAKRRSQNLIGTLYPETGPLCRHNYPKIMQFFAAGKEFNERAIIASNRSGKSLAICYELVLHMTGNYPEWWDGFRYRRPIVAWAGGTDTKSVRESLQFHLIGPPGSPGTGLVPAKLLLSTSARSGVPEAVDAFTVKHRDGGVSRCVFKTYDQGRESWQASKVDVVLMDEEPPLAIYSEALTRTMSTVPGEPSGRMMCAFTPLLGLSGLVLSYMPGGERVEGAI